MRRVFIALMIIALCAGAVAAEQDVLIANYTYTGVDLSDSGVLTSGAGTQMLWTTAARENRMPVPYKMNRAVVVIEPDTCDGAVVAPFVSFDSTPDFTSEPYQQLVCVASPDTNRAAIPISGLYALSDAASLVNNAAAENVLFVPNYRGRAFSPLMLEVVISQTSNSPAHGTLTSYIPRDAGPATAADSVTHEWHNASYGAWIQARIDAPLSDTLRLATLSTQSTMTVVAHGHQTDVLIPDRVVAFTVQGPFDGPYFGLRTTTVSGAATSATVNVWLYGNRP